jgi:hypothetical protein
MNARSAFLDALPEISAQFGARPFDFVTSEREAEFRLYQAIKSRLDQGNVTFTVQGAKGPRPPVVHSESERIRIEYYWRRERGTIQPDIMVLRAGTHIDNLLSDDAVELIVEVKICWGSGCGTALWGGLEQVRRHMSSKLPAELVLFRADNCFRPALVEPFAHPKVSH